MQSKPDNHKSTDIILSIYPTVVLPPDVLLYTDRVWDLADKEDVPTRFPDPDVKSGPLLAK